MYNESVFTPRERERLEKTRSRAEKLNLTLDRTVIYTAIALLLSHLLSAVIVSILILTFYK